MSPDGTKVFVSGTSYQGERGDCSDYATVAYEAGDGSRLWAAEYDGTGHWCDDVAGLALSADGNRLFVTGTSEGSDTGSDLVTIAYDAASGSQLWVARQDGPFHGNDKSTGVVTNIDTSIVYVAGTFQMSECGDDFDPCESNIVAVGYDAATGSPRWIGQHEPPEGKAFTTAVTGSTDGRSLYVTGLGSGSSFETVAFDTATGARRWSAQSEDEYLASSIATSSDSELVFVAGQWESGYAVVAYAAADGSRVWTAHKRSSNFGGPELAVTPAASAAYLLGDSRDDYLVIAFDGESGRTTWRETFAGPGGEDYPTDVATSADGAIVFITGSSQRRGSYRSSYATVAFDALTGNELWADRYGGRFGGFHTAWAIAADPVGGVYVTGESDGTSGWSDFATIKYTSN